MIYLDYLLLFLKTDKIVDIGPCWVSDIISEEYTKRFSEAINLRNSASNSPEKNHHAYFYPRLQYKVVRNSPMIASINEGCDLLWDLYEKFSNSNGDRTDWQITERRLIDKKAAFGLINEYNKYRFLTPWLSLPEEEFKNYLTADGISREKILVNVLENQIKSMADSLGYQMDGILRAKMIIKPNYIFQREIHYAGMLGSFIANFEIPNFLGVGKSVSRGFGTIKQI